MRAAAEAGSLRIRLFGPFQVTVSEQALPPLRSRKVPWLLALLALRAGREVERSWLAGTLWPESSEAQALVNLRSSLVLVRSALEPEGWRMRSPTPHSLSLDLAGVEVDVIAFDQALAAAGSYAAALWVYRELRLRLHREINANPDPETQALVERLRAEARAANGRSVPRPAAQPAARESPADPIPACQPSGAFSHH